MLSVRGGMFGKLCVFLVGALATLGLGIGVGAVAQNAFASNPDASIEKLLSNPAFSAPDNVRAIFRAAQADWRIVALLNESLGHHQLGLAALEADGRGATIVTVDGTAVGPTNIPARELAGDLGDLDSSIRPTSIGTPFSITSSIYFTDEAHQSHISIRFESPTPPLPATTPTTQPVTTTTTEPSPPPTTTAPPPTTTVPPPTATQTATSQPVTPPPNPPATSTTSTTTRYGSVKQASIKPLKKSLQATFVFATIPTHGSRLQIVWSLNKKRMASNAVPLGAIVTSSLLMLKGPSAGTWTATLRARPPRAGWKTVKETRLRIV